VAHDKQARNNALKEVRQGFNDRGEAVSDWARRHGFPPNAVYQVLNGYTTGSRGTAHRIAVALGLKPSQEQPKSPTDHLASGEFDVTKLKAYETYEFD